MSPKDCRLLQNNYRFSTSYSCPHGPHSSLNCKIGCICKCNKSILLVVGRWISAFIVALPAICTSNSVFIVVVVWLSNYWGYQWLGLTSGSHPKVDHEVDILIAATINALLWVLIESCATEINALLLGAY